MADRELVLVAQPVLDDSLARARDLFSPSEIRTVEPYTPDQDLPEALARDCTVLFADAVPANVEAMSRLRWIQLGSHGYGQLSGLRLQPDIVVTNASGVNDIPIAEWCLMMMLALSRDLPGMLSAQREHRWDRHPIFQNELSGKRVGIFGYGNIGRELNRLCLAFGLSTSVLSRSGTGSRGLRYDARPGATESPGPSRSFGPSEMPTFLADLDFLVLTAPVTNETRGLFDAAALARLPAHACLLNPARAGLVDEQALLSALQNGQLAGAALDDHYRQPMPEDDPFFDLPNTIVTSHISGSAQSPHFVERIWDLFLDNLARHRDGHTKINLIKRKDLDLDEEEG